MEAVFFRKHGGPDVLEYGDFPEPEVSPGFVKLRVRACSLNYLDIFTRRGLPGIRVELPMITGGDCVGEISELGPDVAGWSEGQRVLVDPIHADVVRGQFAMLGETRRGGLAEYTLVHESQLLALPDDVSDEAAACLPVAYGTSHRMLRARGQLQAGEKILILGASGGVGTSSLLIAKALGAYVIAAAGSEAKCARLRELGADETVDYSQTGIHDYCKRTTGSLFRGGGYDVVVNFTGGETWAPSLRCVNQGGRLLTCGATAGFDPPTDLRYIWTAEMDVRGSNGWRRSDLVELIEEVHTGRLEPVIDRVVPLAQAIEALRDLEDRHVFGKIVVRP